MSECDNCGRDDGHWLGCAVTEARLNHRRGDAMTPLEAMARAVHTATGCSFDGCSEPRRSADKRVKFCEFHSDPKNRK